MKGVEGADSRRRGLNISWPSYRSPVRSQKKSKALEQRRGPAWSISAATAADALDLAVEGCVFLAERIVRVAEILLAGHIADARWR